MKKLRILLNSATDGELSGLAEILECNSKVDEIILYIQDSAQGLFGSELTYKEILFQVAKKLSIDFAEPISEEELEIKIAQNAFNSILEKSTPTQRENLERELHKIAKKYDKSGELLKSGSILATLTAAQLSGFGVYLLASTTLGAITGVMGVALPFVVYTTISSAISIIIGPVGWIGAGLYALWKLTGPDYKKLIPSVLYICMLRSSIAERKKEQKTKLLIGMGILTSILVIFLIIVYFVI